MSTSGGYADHERHEPTVDDVTGLLWSDRSGFFVVEMKLGDDFVAVPVQFRPAGTGESSRWSPAWRTEDWPRDAFRFPVDDVTLLSGAPRVADLSRRGWSEVVDLVSHYYGVHLAGPPPGPGTTPPPSWPWKGRHRKDEKKKDKGGRKRDEGA